MNSENAILQMEDGFAYPVKILETHSTTQMKLRILTAAHVAVSKEAKLRLSKRMYMCKVINAREVSGHWNVTVRLEKDPSDETTQKQTLPQN